MSNYNSTLQSNNTDLQDILNTINALPNANSGIELPALTNEGTTSDLLANKQLIDSNGNIVTGSMMTYDGSYECDNNGTNNNINVEWQDVFALPTTYIVVGIPKKFYIEKPTNFKIIVVRYLRNNTYYHSSAVVMPDNNIVVLGN
jgi:hypothetical protein